MAEPDTLLDDLRMRARNRRERGHAVGAFGDRAADVVAATVGSWRFILIQSGLLALWIVWNAAAGRPFDPFPFILLNLMLSFQAAFTAPSS
jgi:uncharacterized membrane protein